jgi:hypothetical protein
MVVFVKLLCVSVLLENYVVLLLKGLRISNPETSLLRALVLNRDPHFHIVLPAMLESALKLLSRLGPGPVNACFLTMRARGLVGITPPN